MNILKFLCSVFLSFIFIVPSLAQENNSVMLEGQWKLVDWTYISFVGRSLDERERQEINESLKGLVFDFRLDQTISTNKPDIFNFLDNKMYKVEGFNWIEIDNHSFDFLIRDNRSFFLLRNIMLELEKIKDYTGAKIELKKLPEEFINTSKIDQKKHEILDKVYTIEELDVFPKYTLVEFTDNCTVYCLYNLFNRNMISYIDFSKVEKDISYFISFIIDKSGGISNVKIKHRKNKMTNKGNRYPKITVQWETNEKIPESQLSEIELSILKSILTYDGDMIPGVKNGQNVNTEINLELRLISD